MESAVPPAAVRSPAALWLAVVGAPAVWAAQGLLGWFIETQACAGGTTWPLSSSGVKGIELAISAAAFATAALAFWVGLRHWRVSSDTGIYGVHGRERHAFLAAVAWMVSGIFMLAIVWAALSVAMLPVCEGWR